MPTYQYVCTNPDDKHEFEVVQSFSDAPVSECTVCASPVRKVYGSVGVVFKGSGFYRTDSRAGASNGSSKDGAAKDSSAKDGSAKDSSSGRSSSSKESTGTSAASSSGASSSSSGSSGTSKAAS